MDQQSAINYFQRLQGNTTSPATSRPQTPMEALASSRRIEAAVASDGSIAALAEASERKKNELPDWLTSLGVGGSQLVSSVGTIYGLLPGANMDNALRETGNRWLEQVEARRGVNLASKLNERRAKVDAQTDELSKFGTAFWETVGDGDLLFNLVMEQLPMMAAGGLAGRGALMLGATQKAAMGTAVAVNAGLTGADVGSQVYEDLLALPEELWQQNPEYLSRSAEMGGAEARRSIALDRARAAAAVSAVTSGVAQRLPGAKAIEDTIMGKVGGLTGTLPGRAVVGALGEGGQEVLEEGGGRVIGNVAVSTVDPSRQFNEGLGESAALGLLGGGVMGGVAGALTPQEELDLDRKPQIPPEQVAAFKAAVETGDVAPLLDRNNKQTYNRAFAVEAYKTRANNEQLPAEERQKAEKGLADMVTELESTRTMLEKDLESSTPEAITQLETSIAGVQQQLQDEQLEEAERNRLTQLESVLSQQLEMAREADPESTKQSIARIESELDLARKAQESITVIRGAETPETFENAVEVAATETDPVAKQAKVDDAITVFMASPTVASPQAAQAMLQNTQLNLDAEQTAYLSKFTEAAEAVATVEGMAGVSGAIFQGADGFKGIPQYEREFRAGLSAKNPALIERARTGLTKFAQAHAQKAAAFSAAFQAAQKQKKPVFVSKDASAPGGWKLTAAKPANWKEGGGNFQVHVGSGKLVSAMQAEAKALQAAAAKMTAAQALVTRRVTPTSAKPAPASTPASVAPKAPATQASSPSTSPAPEAPVAAPEPVAEASPVESQAEPAAEAVVAEPAPEAEQTDGKLRVIKSEEERVTGSMPQEMYESTNLVSAYFKQAAGSAKAMTLRPLVAVKDFLSQWAADPTIGHKFWAMRGSERTGESLTARQANLLQAFRDFALRTQESIQKNADRANFLPKAANRDYVQFLFRDGGFDENTLTAISYGAFRWMLDNGGNKGFNDDGAINRMFGRSEDDGVPDTARILLQWAGTRDKVAVQEMGKHIREALGLTADRNAPMNEQAELELALGAQAMALLLQQGLVEQTSIDRAELTATGLVENGESGITATDDSRVQLYFLKPAATEAVTELVELGKGTNSVLNKMFNTEDSLVFPEIVEPKFQQKTVRRRKQLVPKVLRNILDKVGRQPYEIRPEMKAVRESLINSLGRETFLKLFGYTEVTESMHKVNRLKAEAKNATLELELARLEEFESLMDEAGGPVPFYLPASVWVQQRVGLASNAVNPQSSKLHRHLVSKSAWKTQVDPRDADAELTVAFKLAVAQALGVDTDKQPIADSLATFDAFMRDAQAPDSILGAAVNAIEIMLGKSDASLGETEGQALLDTKALLKAKEGFLDGLVNLVRYKQALETGASFETSIMYEVDGVTNGPALAHIQLGELRADNMEYFGFYTEASKTPGYAQSRKGGMQDLYETTLKHVLANLTAITEYRERLSALAYFTGQLAVGEKVTGRGRGWMKTPLTAMIFGSSPKGAVDSMSEELITSVYNEIEKAANSTDPQALPKTLSALNQLLGGRGRLSERMSPAEALEMELTPAQVGELKKVFNKTLGVAVRKTMETQFKDFMQKRRVLNQAAQGMFAMYKAAFDLEKDRLLLRKEEKGQVKRVGGEFRQDLTAAEEDEIHEALGDIFPLVHTALSLESGELDAGLMPVKRENRFVTNKSGAYTQEVAFGQDIPTNSGDGSFKTRRLSAAVSKAGNPGVATMIMLIHAMDSAIASKTYGEFDSLNVHDAIGFKLGDAFKGATLFNQNTFQQLTQYSAPMQILAGWERSYTAFSEQYGSYPQVVEQVQTEMAAYDGELQAYVAPDLARFSKELRATALKMEQQKLAALSQVTLVDQYALDGAGYVVTEADQKMVADRLAEVGQGLKEAAQPRPIPTPADTAWGQVGMPNTASDPILVKAVQGGTTVKQLWPTLVHRLKNSNLDSTAKEALVVLAQTLAAKAPADTRIELVTPTTPKADDTDTSASYAWFDSESNTIFVKSPEFLVSSVTPDILLHEIVHAATVNRMKANPNDPAVVELKGLLEKAKAYVEEQGLNKYVNAVSSVEELVAYGMTNQGFQRDVLSKLQMATTAGERSAASGLREFIRSLVKLLVSGVAKTREAMLENGLSILIANTAMVLELETKRVADEGKTYFAGPTNPTTFTTEQVFDALGGLANGRANPVWDGHLRTVLAQVVDAAYGAFGQDKAPAERMVGVTPEDAFLNSLQGRGTAFVSRLNNLLNLSHQESFVVDSVEVAVREALSSPEATQIRKELRSLFQEAKSVVRPQDLVPNWDTATEAEKAQATEAHKAIFTLEQNADGSSDYLSQFAAAALGVPAIYQRLHQIQARRDTRSYQGLNLAQKMMLWFDRAMTRLRYYLTDTNENQTGSERLRALARKLAQVEVNRKATLKRRQDRPDSLIVQKAEQASEAAQEALEAFGKKPFFRNSGNALLRASGSLLSAVAGNRGPMIVDAFLKMSDRTFKERRGVLASLIKEAMGPDEVFQALSMAANKHQQQRQMVKDSIAALVNKGFGRELTKGEEDALGYGLLRTDMSALYGAYNMAQIEDMVRDPAVMNAEIDKLISQLGGPYVGEHVLAAKGLAFYMARGKVVVDQLRLNAHNIAYMWGTPQKITDGEAATVAGNNVEIIDRLVSLYALSYLDSVHRSAMLNVMAEERARGNGQNGIEAVLSLHKAMKVESASKLFDGPGLMMKGYTKEIFDPSIDVRVARTADERKALLNAGYELVSELQKDSDDPTVGQRGLFVARDAGLVNFQTGIISYTGQRSRGTSLNSGIARSDDSVNFFNQRMTNRVKALKEARAARLLGTSLGHAKSFNPMMVKNTARLVPVFNDRGEVANHRYLMNHEMKDQILKRNNRIDQLLGATAASVFDKVGSEELNNETIVTLKAAYEVDKVVNPEAYIEYGPDSADPDIRENYRLLPEATKRQIIKVWGGPAMMVSRDQLDMTFGYRKWSLSDSMSADAQRMRWERMGYGYKESGFETMTLNMLEVVTDRYPGIGRKVRAGEDIWQAIVTEIKDILVIKSVVTLVGNMTSNVSMLVWMGVPFKDIPKYLVTGLKAALDYRAQQRELFELQTRMTSGIGVPDMQAAQQRVIELQDSMQKSPVKELIDAGMLQTIVEDIDALDDPYSYKSRLTRLVDEKTSWVPASVKTVGRYAYMAHDTPVYRVLYEATQLSDFVARYAVHQHMTTRKNPLSKAESLSLAMKAFVNYDLPTHRSIQYLNDMGLLWFTKYYVRIQAVILQLYREKPAQALGLMIFNNYFSNLPIITDSAIWEQSLDSRLGGGAIEFPTVLDDLATVKAALTPF